MKGKVMQIKQYDRSTQVTNTESFAFIPVSVFKLLSREVLFTKRDESRNC